MEEEKFCLYGKEAFVYSPEAMLVLDSKGIIVSANKKLFTLFDYKEGELVGRHINVLVPNEYKNQHETHLKNYLKKPKERLLDIDLSIYGLTKFHKKLPLEVELNPFVSNNQRYISVSVRDITYRLVAENKFKRLLESAPDALVFVDKQGEIKIANRQAEVLFGYSRKDLIGQNISILIPSRFNTYHDHNIKDYFKTPFVRSMGASDPLYAKKSTGEDFPVEITLSPIETEEGLMVCAAVRDVSARRYIDELEAKNETLQQFNYVVSHDLQEPLNTILGFIHLMEITPNMDEEEKQEFFGHIKKSTEGLKELIQGLMEFSKLGSSLSNEKVNLNELVQQICQDLSSIITSKKAKIDIGDLPVVTGSKAELKSIFQNLISNALKFQGHEKEPLVQITAERHNSEWKFMVKDNGIGIHDADKDRIFKIFMRVDKSNFSGSGIGLAHVKKLLTLFNGRIWLESKPREGSTFYFTIPAETFN